MKANKRSLVVSIAANLVSVVVSLGISFLLTPYLIDTAGKEAYSFFPLANNFVSYMSIITLALNSMASRFITISLVQKDVDKAHRYFSSVFFSNVLLSAILLLPCLVITVFIDHFLNIPTELVGDVRMLFGLVFASMIVNLIFSVYDVSTFATNRMDLRGGKDILQNVLRAALLILLYRFCAASVVYLGIAALFTMLFNGVMQYFFTRKLLPDYRVRLAEFDKTAVKEILSSGVWNSINSIGSILLQSVSLLIANIMIGAAEAADLSIVQTLSNLMTTVICAIYGVLLSRISLVYAQGNTDATVEEVRFSQKILGLISTTPGVLIIIFGKAFYSLWVPDIDAGYLQVLSIANIIPVLIHSSMWTVYGLNVTNNKLKQPALVLILTGAVSAVLSIILIQLFDMGILALPVASAVCNVLFYVVYLPAYAAKEMGVRPFTFYPHMGRSLVFCAVMILLLYPLVDRLAIGSWVAFFGYGAVAGCIGLVLYVLICFTKKDRTQLLDGFRSRLKGKDPA